MIVQRVVIGIAAGVLVTAGALVAPAFGATEVVRPAKRAAAVQARGAGSFTPSAADPRLAAVFARGGLGGAGFRFTPSESRRSDRAVTVAVRARSSRSALDANRVASAAAAAPVGLAPIAYNLGVAVGWQRFALSGDLARVDLAGQPGGRERVDVGVSYAGKRVTGRVQATADRVPDGALKFIDIDQSYSLDVGGSYSLTRNLDVTAGVRYRSDRERLARVADDRRDSQAVYVGTAFRF